MATRARTVTAAAVLAAVAAPSCGTRVDGEVAVDTVRQAASASVSVSFQYGVFPTSGYVATIDDTIRQLAPTTNYGSATTCESDGDDGNGADKSCLIQWSVADIPAGSTVQSASITLRIVNSSSSTYNVQALNRAFSESQATWNRASSSQNWATAGAMGAADRGAVIGTVTGSLGSKTIALNAAGVALVQSWVDGGANAGIIIASSANSDGLGFSSSEATTASNRPKLTVTYAPPADPGSGGASGSGGSTSGGTPGTGGATATGGTPATGGTGTGGAPDTGGASNTGGAPDTGGAPNTGGTPDTGGAPAAGGGAGAGGGIPTDPDLKIGFIGDTDSGSGFTSVLNVIKNEGASAVVVEGDMSYSANPSAWWAALESVMGTSFPVFLVRGNHDSSWSGYFAKAANHLGGAAIVAGAHDASYKATFRGLVLATIRKGDTSSNITPFLQGDDHIWKVCNWHENQQAMQIGAKTDEMGWGVYETCRQQGAIIETAHEHSYERTKTLTNTSTQLVDSSCASASALCVGPGRTFVNVVGLGGESIRDQQRCLPSAPPYGCKGEWAFIYTTNQGAALGAQFITFNAGNPKIATGYFKNVNGLVVDSFTIQHD